LVKVISFTDEEVNLMKHCLVVQTQLFKDLKEVSNMDTSKELKLLKGIIGKL
jgi:hypothetical protein